MRATRYQYQTHDSLNFTALDYRAAWLWSLTPNLTGILSADRSQGLTSYADFNNPGQRNIQTNETQRLMADWAVGGGWHLVGGGYETRSRNSGNFTAVGNYVQDTAEAGVKYVTAADNSIAVVRRESRGDYSGRTLVNDGNFLDTGYKQSETEAHGLWRISGHSSLDARLGYVERNHDNYSLRDYSGAVGGLSYLWTPTGKLQFTLAAGRDRASYQETIPGLYSGSYYVADSLSLTPAWLISDKTTLRLKLDISQRDYRGAVVAVASNREDTLRSAQLRATWRPTRTIDIDGYLTHEQRSSNVDTANYHDNMIAISAALKF